MEGFQPNPYNPIVKYRCIVTDPQDGIDALRRKVKKGERDIQYDCDRDVLLEFSDRLRLLRQEYSDHRHLKLLRHCVRMAEYAGCLTDALEDRDASEEIVRWINETYENQETNRDYRVALRVFGKRVVDDNDGDPPPSIAWVPSKTSRDYKPTPNPAEMLDFENDVRPMIKATTNVRQEALIALQFDAGLRGGELYDLTIGDISDGKHGKRVRVDGKTGQRTVDRISSVPHLQKWLSEHPARDDPEVPLWSKLSTPDQVSYQQYLDDFKTPAAKAGVKKPVTPTAFRKSNATWLAKQGANSGLIEDRQGRTRGSKAVSRYVARFGEDAADQYAKMHGIEVEVDEMEGTAPVKCPRCDRETPADRDFCMWCDQALEHGVLDELEEEQEAKRRKFLRMARDDPELLDEVEETEDLIEFFDGDTSPIRDARRFVDALDAE